MSNSNTPILDLVKNPKDLRGLKPENLTALAQELRQEVINAVSVTGGHLGAGLGVVELTIALHYVYQTCLLYTSPSPRDGLLSRMPSSA